jgi:AraC-like DNA-binding protein
MRVPIQKSAIPDSRVFVIKDLQDAYFDPNWHFHPEYQLFVVLKGHGTRFVGDTIKPFKEGDLLLSGPNLPHLWRCHESYFAKDSQLSTRGIVIYFDENFLGHQMLEKEELAGLKYLFEKAKRGLEYYGHTRSQVREWMLKMVSSEGIESVIQFLKILSALAHSKEYKYVSSGPASFQLKASDGDRMNLVHHYVIDNFRRKITLEEAASLANLSPVAFSRYFKTRANKTYSSFVSEVRVGQACHMLVDGELSVAAVGFECGYKTLSNFNRQFREITGMAPLEYRKEYRKVI